MAGQLVADFESDSGIWRWRLKGDAECRIDRSMLAELRQISKEQSIPADANVVELSSSDSALFSAGLDSALFVEARQSRQMADEIASEILDTARDLFFFPLPMVARIHGHALGAAAIFALCADYRLIAPSARIGFPEVRLAMSFPAFFARRLIELCGEPRSRELLYRGRALRGAAAVEAGLADRCLEQPTTIGQGESRVAEIEQLAAIATPAGRRLKEAMREGYRPLWRSLAAEDHRRLATAIADPQVGHKITGN